MTDSAPSIVKDSYFVNTISFFVNVHSVNSSFVNSYFVDSYFVMGPFVQFVCYVQHVQLVCCIQHVQLVAGPAPRAKTCKHLHKCSGHSHNNGKFFYELCIPPRLQQLWEHYYRHFFGVLASAEAEVRRAPCDPHGVDPEVKISLELDIHYTQLHDHLEPMGDYFATLLADSEPSHDSLYSVG